jgi:HPt (histidine-containing phosphotransfer) domain-containing protein
MDDYLPKPIDSLLLLAKLNAISERLHPAMAGASAINSEKPGDIDLSQLESLRQLLPPSALAEQLTLLLETFMPSVERIGVGLADGNLTDSAKVAHDLVSAAGNFGARRVSVLAREVEQACRRSEPGIAADRFAELRPAAERAFTAFEKFGRRAA